MNHQVTMQGAEVSSVDPSSICSFDYEAIQAPTKALMHQAARFLYIKNGRGTIVIDNVKYEMVPHTLIAIVPFVISDIIAVDEPIQLYKLVYDYSYVNATMKNSFGNEGEVSELIMGVSSKPLIHLDSVEADYIENLLEQIKAETGLTSTLDKPKKRPLSSLLITVKLIELMVMYRRFNLAANGEKDVIEDGAKPPMSSLYSYIYAHSSEKLTLERLSKVFYVSESALAKHISQITGSTFSKILNNIRVEKASDYLIYTDMTLNEIASILGYVDASHLSKRFYAKVGTTPIKYRRIYRKTKEKIPTNVKETAFSVQNYIYHNYNADGISVESVSEQFGMQAAELNRLLLYYSGMNFENLLNYVRISKACELLINSDQEVMRIASIVGYNNIKTFNVNFYRYENMTPTHFREMVTLQRKDGSEKASRRHRKKETGEGK